MQTLAGIRIYFINRNVAVCQKSSEELNNTKSDKYRFIAVPTQKQGKANSYLLIMYIAYLTFLTITYFYIFFILTLIFLTSLIFLVINTVLEHGYILLYLNLFPSLYILPPLILIVIPLVCYQFSFLNSRQLFLFYGELNPILVLDGVQTYANALVVLNGTCTS